MKDIARTCPSPNWLVVAWPHFRGSTTKSSRTGSYGALPTSIKVTDNHLHSHRYMRFWRNRINILERLNSKWKPSWIDLRDNLESCRKIEAITKPYGETGIDRWFPFFRRRSPVFEMEQIVNWSSKRHRKFSTRINWLYRFEIKYYNWPTKRSNQNRIQ